MQYRQPDAPAGWRRDDRRRLGERRPARPRDPGLRSPRRALRRASMSGCRAPIAAATSSGGWMPSARWISATTRWTNIERARRLPSLQLDRHARARDDRSQQPAPGRRRDRRPPRRAARRQGAVLRLACQRQCALADLKMNRLLASIDAWVTANGHEEQFRGSLSLRADGGRCRDARLSLDLNDGRHQDGDLGDRISPGLFLARCAGARSQGAHSARRRCRGRARACTSWACRSCAGANHPSSTEPRMMPRTSRRICTGALIVPRLERQWR